MMGSSSENHGNIPLLYAVIRREGLKSPPTAIIPSSFAWSTDGKGVLLVRNVYNLRSYFLAYDFNGSCEPQ